MNETIQKTAKQRPSRIAVTREQLEKIGNVKDETEARNIKLLERFISLTKTTLSPYFYTLVSLQDRETRKIDEKGNYVFAFDVYNFAKDNISPASTVAEIIEMEKKNTRFSNKTIFRLPNNSIDSAFKKILETSLAKYLKKHAILKGFAPMQTFGVGGRTRFIQDKVILTTSPLINYEWVYFHETRSFGILFHENLYEELAIEEKIITERNKRISAKKNFDNGTDNPNLFNPVPFLSKGSPDDKTVNEQIEEVSKEATSEISFGFNGG